ncbi:MAG: glycosyltransferase [Lachnospira sp.]
MKIYIYRYGSICKPDVIDAFKRLGLEVDEEAAEIYNKNILPAQCVNLVSQKLLSQNYSFVFTINFFPWLSDLCNIAHITYISLIVDSPVLKLYSDSLTNSCNRVFLFDRMLFNEFEPRNPGHIFHIPLATNTVRNDSVINNAGAETKEHFKSDISFIGSTYAEKCPFNRTKLPEFEKGFADGLIEAQLKVYGYNFIEDVISDEFAETFLKYTPGSYRFPQNFHGNNKALVAQQYLSVKVAEQERLRVLKMLSDNFNVDIYTGSDTSLMPNIHNRGFAKSLEEMPIIFNQSKINLNITAKSIRSGLSLRVFDVLGCGGFLITNYQAELPEIFEIGKDLVAYESMQHLYELCDYYLKHDDERMEIASNGYEKVKKFHSYDVRLLQMIDMAFPAN